VKQLIPQLALAVLLFCGVSRAAAAAGEIHLRVQDTNTLIQIEGDHDDDWRVQISTNLVAWSNLTSFGTLISGGQITNAPWRSAGTHTSAGQFYRALKTVGLFDPSLFRTVNLVFTQANWSALLASGRTYDTNTACTVFLDNGATNFNVGARYKGNTSYTMSGTKKSINMEFDWKDTNADLMTYQTVNLNNASGDETIMREALYFNVMSRYTPCPQGAMAKVNINGNFWGVYSLVQQENTQLIKQWFPSATGDRWRSPNAPAGGMGFSSSNSAFAYFGTNIGSYVGKYQLKTDNVSSNAAWGRLVNAITTLNTTPTNVLRDAIENTWAVDNWLWFLAIENIFADDDSYWNKGADFGFYYEPESGRLHPVEHDGNEAFVAGDTNLSPLVGFSVTGGNATLSNRPVIYRFLANGELRQRYLAHMRTVLQEYYNPPTLVPMINAYVALSINAIIADTNKGYTSMATYTNDLNLLKTYVTNRYNYLNNHAELTPSPPNILNVYAPTSPPTPTEVPIITAQVLASGTNGINSVWLYYRDRNYGRFAATQMFDDGLHGDGGVGDAVFGAATTNFPAGNKVRYYVEARSANAARAASFSPARAENVTYSYRVALTTATNTPVVINEFMASNASTLADPQGEFDDWIELHNVTDAPVDLTGHYLTDEPTNPRKWQFPSDTMIPADGYLLVWADEDGLATPGLHASFKLSGSGEEIYLIDTDANLNAVLDRITFGTQTTDVSFGRSVADADVWAEMSPTPAQPNH
jgi:spore coat protein CotH